MKTTIKQNKLSLKERLRNWLIGKLGAVCEDFHQRQMMAQGVLSWESGFTQGRKGVQTRFAVLPLPFTAAQLQGALYGDHITAGGSFAVQFGECNIPAPGQHGYEQRAHYVTRDNLNASGGDLICHRMDKFADPANSDALVPVIVTVLR